jgi:cobalt-precorrin 5A hydrolase
MATQSPDRTAIFAISLPGCRLALRLGERLPGADLFLPEHVSAAPAAKVSLWSGRASGMIRQLFAGYRRIVIFGSVGMAVRLIAPLVRDKRIDPAVVVVDDAGSFAVSLLSGHLGGANRLAVLVGEVLGARPVITTASDALGFPPVDLIGRELGWRMEDRGELTRVSAAVVNGETVGLLQEAGERDRWLDGKPWPPNLLRLDRLEDLASSDCRAAIIITDRLLRGEQSLPPHVILRPRSLVVGIGCNRGTGREEIDQAVRATLEGHGLSPASLAAIGTVDLKSDEQGLRDYAEASGVELLFFSPQQLDEVEGLPSPSGIVARWIGSRGVCEPAAILASGSGSLLVKKQKMGNVTVAVARRALAGKEEDR